MNAPAQPARVALEARISALAPDRTSARNRIDRLVEATGAAQVDGLPAVGVAEPPPLVGRGKRGHGSSCMCGPLLILAEPKTLAGEYVARLAAQGVIAAELGVANREP